MTTRQAAKTVVHYSFVLQGRVRAGILTTHHARLHESALKAIEQGIETQLVAFAADKAFALRPDEPAVFIYDIQHVKG